MSKFVACIIARPNERTLSCQVAKALQIIESEIATYNSCDKEVLREILKAVVEFRVALVMGDTKQKEQSMQKVDQLYLALQSTETEEVAIELSNRIAVIIVNERRGKNAESKKGHR